MFKLTLSLLSLILFLNLTFAEKISIQADKFKSEAEKFVYVGNVVLKTDKGKIVNCDRLVVFLNKNGKIKKAMAVGHVKYRDKHYEAVGNVMIYIPSQKVIILEGNALVKSEKGIIRGDRIVYNLENDTLKAESKRRVQTVFEIEEKR